MDRDVRLTEAQITTIGSTLTQHRWDCIRWWLHEWDRTHTASNFWAQIIMDVNDAHYALHKGTSLVDQEDYE